MAAVDAMGTVIDPCPVPSRVALPRLKRPNRLADTVPVATGPPVVAGATATLKVTGSAKIDGLTFDVTERLTEPLPVTTGEDVLPS